MENKAIFHQFDPYIYPVKLWITITKDFKALSDRFCVGESKEDIDISFMSKCEAATYYVMHKEKPCYHGILIATTSKAFFSTKNIAHEATHAARMMWRHMGEDVTGEEADAYLVGWIAECCEKVKLNKE